MRIRHWRDGPNCIVEESLVKKHRLLYRIQTSLDELMIIIPQQVVHVSIIIGPRLAGGNHLVSLVDVLSIATGWFRYPREGIKEVQAPLRMLDSGKGNGRSRLGYAGFQNDSVDTVRFDFGYELSMHVKGCSLEKGELIVLDELHGLAPEGLPVVIVDVGQVDLRYKLRAKVGSELAAVGKRARTVIDQQRNRLSGGD